LIDYIEKLYNNNDSHTLLIPIAKELLSGMVIELQEEIGKKHNVKIQQLNHLG